MPSLPADVLQVFDPSILGEPHVAVRSLFDLEGNLGETHVIADRRTLHLLVRPLGGAFVKMSLPLDRVERLSLQPNGMYHVLELVGGGQERRIRFTTWDQPELERLITLWKGVGSGGESGSVGPTMAPPGPLAAIHIPVAPRVLLAASLEAMAEVDGDVGPLERAAIQRVLGESPAEAQGLEHLRRHGLEAVLSALATGLSLPQKRCLLANLLAVAASDGWLRSKEQALLERFEEATGLGAAETQTLRDALFALFNVAVFADEVPGSVALGGLTPVEVLCASLFLMTQEDGHVAGEELEALERIVPDPEAWTGAAAVSATRGMDGLLREAGGLNRAQQRCLLANLLAVAMSDGWLRGAEQARIERFRQALSISPEAYTAIYRVLMAKDDLSVFPVS